MRPLLLLLSLVLNDTPALATDQLTCGPGVVEISGEITNESAAEFKSAFEAADEAGPVTVEIDSPGGDVEAGWRMAQAILDAKHPVTCVVQGSAHSMAFYVLQYCPTRVMTANSTLMMHESYLRGPIILNRLTYIDAENYVAYLRTLNRTLITPAAKRMGFNNVDEFLRWIHGRDWWLTSEDAIKYRAVDKVIEP